MRRAVATGAALVALLAVSATAGPAYAAPPNDNFADATVLAEPPVTITADPSEATGQPGEPFHFFEGRTVWYRWTASSSGSYTVGCPVRRDQHLHGRCPPRTDPRQ